jgi:uncharacterized RDD family membrane protein YckC
MDHEPNQPQSSSYGQEPPPHAPPYYDQQHYDQPQLQYVSVWPRAAATIIDSFLLVVIIDFLIIILIPTHDNASIPLFFIAFFGSILVFFGYFIVMEAIWGATLGKMMLGLRVVKTDGSPLGWSQAVIRNLLRVIDGLFSYLVGAILIWDSPLRQRLGDRAAKTVVVRRRPQKLQVKD